MERCYTSIFQFFFHWYLILVFLSDILLTLKAVFQNILIFLFTLPIFGAIKNPGPLDNYDYILIAIWFTLYAIEGIAFVWHTHTHLAYRRLDYC